MTVAKTIASRSNLVNARLLLVVSLSAAILLFGVGFYRSVTTKVPIEIIGEFQEKDLVDIQKTVRREIWSGWFPDFTWKDICRTPERFRTRAGARIKSIYPNKRKEGRVFVSIEFGGALKGTKYGWRAYDLERGPNGWVIVGYLMY